MKKKLAVLFAIASFATASSAMAATIYNSQGLAFPADAGVTLDEAYKISYEVYNTTAGATTVASKSQMNILLSQTLTTGQNINIVISNNSALFNSAGTGFKRYGLCDVTAATLPLSAAATCASGEIVATMSPSGLTTDNLGMQATADVPIGAVLRLVQWNDNSAVLGEANNSQLDPTETASLVNGGSLFVKAGLNAGCDLNPIIQMTFSSAGGESTATPITFAYITKQFKFTTPPPSSLNAELDTDVDFTLFVDNTAGYVVAPDEIDVPDIFGIVNLSYPSELPIPIQLSYWISLATAPTGNVTFDIASAVAEPDLLFTFDSTVDSCTQAATNKLWSCEAEVSLSGNHSLDVILDGTSENSPTNWTISNLNVEVTTAGYNQFCQANIDQPIGSWYGGIEAIVPFVKHNATYATFIKLYNRYKSSVAGTTGAKVYVANMNQNTGEIVTSIQQLGQGQYSNNALIPSNGFITVTGMDLLNGGILSAQELTDGAPVKFLIRVPAQAGMNGGLTTGEEWSLDATNVYWYDGTSANVATASIVDPYITGIVVQTYDTGKAQRSIPLVFKSFKQGQYN